MIDNGNNIMPILLTVILNNNDVIIDGFACIYMYVIRIHYSLVLLAHGSVRGWPGFGNRLNDKHATKTRSLPCRLLSLGNTPNLVNILSNNN